MATAKHSCLDVSDVSQIRSTKRALLARPTNLLSNMLISINFKDLHGKSNNDIPDVMTNTHPVLSLSILQLRGMP